MSATALPGTLAQNPRLDQWVDFSSAGEVKIATGKVEIGQGILTALSQIAAEELDVALERIMIRSGDTDQTPNEGYTSGSRSIQYGGVALRLVCAEVRALFLGHVARRLNCDVADLSIRDGGILRGDVPTGHDYWSLAPVVSLAGHASGRARLKPISAHSIVGRSRRRGDLPKKIFGQPIFLHDLVLEGMLHARVVRQPSRAASLQSVDEAAMRRAANAPVEFVRDGNFLAVIGEDETAVEAIAAAAFNHVIWQPSVRPNPQRQEARSLLHMPSIERRIGPPEPPVARDAEPRYEAIYTRPYVAHASIAPSCGLALYEDDHLTVWTHSQGVYPLRTALARTLKLDPGAISVRHVQGAGCYGHNGADDAAADAAMLALRRPGRPVRVRWRREEEFGFEPAGPAMVVKVGALLDEAGRPCEWTAEIWSGTHSSRPGSGGNLLVAESLPGAPPRQTNDVPDSGGGGAARNAAPIYDIPAKRIIHHLVPDTPVRTSALRGLGAMPNVFAIECFIDELAEKAGVDPVAYRLSLLSDVRARRVIERAAEMADWLPGRPAGTGRGRGIGFARYKNEAAYAAVIAELEVEEDVRLVKMWCAADVGLIINPDGAINQLEGGILQSASWALKEQVTLTEAGISSRDWDTYPVLRFSEVPEIAVELVKSESDVPLGVGEAAAGPTAAAIGNAVAHALGARLRDLPLTRERVMAALLRE